MGPLNTQRQRDYVVGLCGEARDAGAEVLKFGEYTCDPDGGNLPAPGARPRAAGTTCGS